MLMPQVSTDGRVYTWGWGLAGQLGHGNCFMLTEPKPVAFFGDEIRIHKVWGVGSGSTWYVGVRSGSTGWGG